MASPGWNVSHRQDYAGADRISSRTQPIPVGGTPAGRTQNLENNPMQSRTAPVRMRLGRLRPGHEMGPASAVIAKVLRRTGRRARHQQRQRKSNSTCDQQRTERVVLHGFRHRLLAAANGVAAVLIGVLGIIDGRIGGVAGDILGLAVEILHRAGGFARAALGLCLRIASQVANSAFNLACKILGRTGNSILVHRGSLLFSLYFLGANRRDPLGFLKRSKCLASERLAQSISPPSTTMVCPMM